MLWGALWLVPAVLVGSAADVPPPPPGALDAAFETLLHAATPAARRAAAEAIAHLPPSGFDAYVTRLFRARPVAAPTFRAVILATWAQVPNPDYPQKGELWSQRPEPRWIPPRVKKGAPRPKRPPPHDPELVEWLPALADLDLDAEPSLSPHPDRAEARAEALEAVALLRAIAASGRPDAVDPLFDFAFTLEGVFRDEAGRAIRSLGSWALPGLIERQHRAGKGLAKQHRWASWQLDRMDRARPSKAIETARDDRARAAILHAYGETRALDAVEAVLGEVDSASHQVRREARWAWMRYVSGPAPPPAPMRKRKLAGGKEESEAKEDYLNYREMAELAIRARIADLRDDDRVPSGSALELTRELFAYHDARRAAEFDRAYQAARARAAAGDVAGALAGYDEILAHDPFDGRRGEIAATLLAEGERRLARASQGSGAGGVDAEAAADLLRRAVALAPDAPGARRAAAEVELVDARATRRREGREDPAALRRALALDPSLAEARAALDGIEAGRTPRGLRRVEVLVGLATVAALLVYGAALWLLRRRRRGGSPLSPASAPTPPLA